MTIDPTVEPSPVLPFELEGLVIELNRLVQTHANLINKIVATLNTPPVTNDGITVGGWPGPITFGLTAIACHVTHSANQSILDGTPTILAFDTERYDPQGMHSTVVNNSRITIPTSGIYTVGGSIRWDTSGTTGSRSALISVNGGAAIAVDTEAESPAIAGAISSLTVNYKFTAGDYVELTAVTNGNGTRSVLAIGNYTPEFWLFRNGS